MNIGIMTVNGFDFHPNMRFKEEAAKLGHRIQLIDPYGMGCVLNRAGASVFMGDKAGLPDLVMPRQGAPMGEYGFVLLRHFTAMDIPLVNGIKGVAIARNQFISLQQLSLAGLQVLDCVFVNCRDNFFAAVERLGGFPVVAKQVDGMGGEGVAKLETDEAALAYLDAHFTPRKGLVVQAFLPPKGRTDIRALVIGGRVAGAMALTPAPGQFKANVHQQGRARAMELAGELKQMAVSAARACCLEVAGVDMMVLPGREPVIGEVNYSPGFRGLESATGLNIAGMILDHALSFADKPAGKEGG
ncbi:MAG: RimK family alpha-L-glutamate ligase [Desulfobacter sp.]|nr:MAG: RimK family alpha-L-glutamate ligase [Desulfobacter sp.]